jgi:hypothetical protein
MKIAGSHVQPSAVDRAASTSSSVYRSPAAAPPRRAAASIAPLGLAPARPWSTSARADSAVARRLLWAFSFLLSAGVGAMPPL